MSGPEKSDDPSFAEQPGDWLDWQAVSIGERPIAEVEAARQAGGESPERLAHARQLFAPYDEREQDDLLDGVLGGLTTVHAVEPTPLRARSRSTTVAIIALLATAAALALWVAWPEDPEPIVARTQPPVPSVALEVRGAIADDWSDAEPDRRSSYRFAPNATFVWTLRPDKKIEDFDPEVRAFVIDEGHERALDLRAVKVEPSERTGAFEITGRISALLPEGKWTIALVYGRQVPTDAHVAASLQDGDDVQIERVVIEVVASVE